jgi:hypothetical protein
VISEHLLVVTVLAEGGALAVALLLLFAHGLQTRARVGLLAKRVGATRAAIIRTVGSADAGPAVAPARPRLPLREELELLGALRPSIGGAQAARLTAMAVDAGLERRGERMCASRHWRRRLRGVRLLTLLGCGERAVPALLADPRFLVRAQAVEWAADHPEPAIVDEIVELLGHPEIVVPFTVRDTLQRIGRPAVLSLVAHLERSSGPAAREPLRVANDLADPRMLGVALRLSSDSDAEVRAESARLLGALGGADAVDAVTRMLGDPDETVRAYAALALGRTGQWAAGPALGACLGDPAWQVRRAAALTLRSFGAPGVLLLRRALKDPDRYARDMARQTLDLPEAAIS